MPFRRDADHKISDALFPRLPLRLDLTIHFPIESPNNKETRPTKDRRKAEKHCALLAIEKSQEGIWVEVIVRIAMVDPHPISTGEDAEVHESR